MWFNSKNKILNSLKKIMLFSNYRDFVREFPGNSLGPLPHLLCFNAGDIWLFSKAQDCSFTDPLFSAPRWWFTGMQRSYPRNTPIAVPTSVPRDYRRKTFYDREQEFFFLTVGKTRGFWYYSLSVVPAFENAPGVFIGHRLYHEHGCHWHSVIGNWELQRPKDMYCFNIKGYKKPWHCE